MKRAQELRADGQRLVAAIIAAQGVASDARESKLIADCLDLVRHELGRLDALLSDNSKIPEDGVYLAVSSLNKGLLEIGGEWQQKPELSHQTLLVTKKAYRFYKETRPAIE